MAKLLRLAFFLTFLFPATVIFGENAITVSTQFNSYTLKKVTDFAEFSTETNISHIKAQIADSNFKHGVDHLHYDPDKVVWGRININNTLTEETYWYLNIGGLVEEMDMFLVDQTTGNVVWQQKAGIDIPLDKKEVQVGRTEIVKFPLIPEVPVRLYIRFNLKSNFSKQLFSYNTENFNLYNEKSYKWNFEMGRSFNTFFYGAILMMLIYNMMLAANLKSKGYLYYIIYVSTFLTFNIFLDGIVYEDFLRNFSRNAQQVRIIVAPIVLCSFIQFTRVYLKTSVYLPKFDKFFVGTMIVAGFVFLFIVSGNWFLGRSILIVMGMVIMLITPVAAYLTIKKGFSSAKFFLLAESLFLISGSVYLLYLSQIIPHSSSSRVIEYIPQLASMVELCIFSLGLADRIKISEQLMLNQQLLQEQEKQELIREKNEELERKVKERTEELRAQKEEIATINEQLEQKVRERTKKLQKAYRDLLNLNYELDSFIYRAAHDIRGPITTIMGLCNLALLEKDPNKCHEYLVILDKFSKNTQHTLNRIVSVNDIKNNPIKPSRFKLSELQNAVLGQLASNPNKNKVIISFDFDPDQTIYSDFYLLQLIVHNLVDNTIRFRTTDPNITATSNISIKIEETGYRITVTDNGTGIEEQIRDKIFDMFFRGSEYSSGSGLGLYISRIAAKKLGGDIELVSTEPGHTVFQTFHPFLKEKEKVEVPEKKLIIINSSKSSF